MMTRTTLKALWFGGGGILATWVAVSPPHVPQTPASAAQPQTTAAERSADALNAQADVLRDRANAVAMRPSKRNPFRFSSPASPARVPVIPEAADLPATDVAPPPARPSLTLTGIAREADVRTAIISSDGQIYLASDGDLVAGRFIVVKVDPEAVLLRDTDGAELRLVLP